MKIWASPYELRPRVSLNRFGSGGRHGSLASLREGRPLTLAARSMELAHVDARARARGVTAFAGRAPKNHFLVTDLNTFDGVVPPEFSTVKLKLGRQVETELAALRKFESAFDGLNLRLLSQNIYEPSAYVVKSDAAEFVAPDGTGFGYDELLKREHWKAL